MAKEEQRKEQKSADPLADLGRKPVPAKKNLEAEEYVAPSEQLESARKFLAKYGVDQSTLSDKEVIEVVERIRTAREEAVHVLSRGQTLDMMEKVLDRYVPDGFVGEFKGDNDASIARARSLGFELLYDKKTNKETATGAADGRIRVGDQVLMAIPIERYIGNRLAKEDRYRERRKRRSSGRRAKAETQDKDDMLPVFDLNQFEPVGAEEE